MWAGKMLIVLMAMLRHTSLSVRVGAEDRILVESGRFNNVFKEQVTTAQEKVFKAAKTELARYTASGAGRLACIKHFFHEEPPNLNNDNQSRDLIVVRTASQLTVYGDWCTQNQAMARLGPIRVAVLSDLANEHVIGEIRTLLDVNGFEEQTYDDNEYFHWPSDKTVYVVIQHVEVAQAIHYLPFIEVVGNADYVIGVNSYDVDLSNILAGLTNKPFVVVPASSDVAKTEGGLLTRDAMLDYCNTGVAVANIDSGFSAVSFVLTGAQMRKPLMEGRRMTWAQYRGQYDSYTERKDLQTGLGASSEEQLPAKMKEAIKFSMKKYNPTYRAGAVWMTSSLGKTDQQLAAAFTGDAVRPRAMYSFQVDPDVADNVKTSAANKGVALHYDSLAKVLWKDATEAAFKPDAFASWWEGELCLVSAGVADQAVLRTAEIIAKLNGISVRTQADLGVNSIATDTKKVEALAGDCDVFIAIAGMEGTLPEVVGAITNKPVIAVPANIGYGAHRDGLTTVGAMANYMIPGIMVMNVENAFGAVMVAISLMHKTYTETT